MDETEWRCRHCGKLLGVLRDGRLHLRFTRGHEYLVGFPTTGVCRGCRTLNEVSDPTAIPKPTSALAARR
jgi:phage FluMu protein Com